MSFASVATVTGISNNDLRVTVRAAHTSSRLKSCSAIMFMNVSSCCFSFLTGFASFIIRIDTGDELNGTMFLSE